MIYGLVIKGKKCPTGPFPVPIANECSKAMVTYFLAATTADHKSLPKAKLAQIAADKVQPVPWVF